VVEVIEMSSVNEGQDKYEERTTADAWQRGINNPDQDPSEGLQEVDGLSYDSEVASQFDNEWEEGVDGNADKYEDNADGDEWASEWGDMSNWNVGQ
jgi:hypothetical protein